VREVLLHHFHRTEEKDVVILAGFGRFGQTILEELQLNAHKDIASVGIIDVDADRRIRSSMSKSGSLVITVGKYLKVTLLIPKSGEISPGDMTCRSASLSLFLALVIRLII
jgi:hypothetical protein